MKYLGKSRSKEAGNTKKMSSKTTMVREINELKKELDNLQGAYDLAIKFPNLVKSVKDV